MIDILTRCGVIEEDAAAGGKKLLVRIVSMLTRMIERGNQVREEGIVYGCVNENGSGVVLGHPQAGDDA